LTVNLQPLIPIIGPLLFALASWLKSRLEGATDGLDGSIAKRATALVFDHYHELLEAQKAMQAEINRLTERMTALELQIAAKDKEISDLKALTEDNTLLIKQLTDEREGLKAQLDTARKELSVLKAERDTAYIERDVARERVKALSLGGAVS